MEKEDNVVFVLQKAIRHFHIKVTQTSVREFLLAHPYYPTLKSVCDALKKWKVEYYPLNLELDEIKSLDFPFIAHLNIYGGQLVFVKKIKSGLIRYYISANKAKIEKFEKFSEKLSGAVVLMEGSKTSGEYEYLKKLQYEILDKSLLPVWIITILFIIGYNLFTNNGGLFLQPGLLTWGLLSTKILGLTASFFLVLHELKIHSRIADKICGFSSKTDCDAVLTSNASRVYGWINWADAGLIFFTGTLLYLITIDEQSSLWLLSLISTVALPYPIFSIYYQLVKVGKWCPFCLFVQVILVLEFVLLFPYLQKLNIQFVEIVRLLISFFIPLSFWLIFKAYLNIKSEKSRISYSLHGFKRNPEIFRLLLRNGGREEIQIADGNLIFGAPDSRVTVTAFLSLYCNPCADAFIQLKSLLENCPELKVNIVFPVYNDDFSGKLFNTLYNIYNKKGPAQTIDFLHEWYTAAKHNRMTFINKEELPPGFDVTGTIGSYNKKLFEDHKVTGTPTIYVNGYKYPAQYSYSDLENFIEELKLITVESKRQEAYANSI